VQGLGYSPFDLESACHPPIEGDTEIPRIVSNGMSRSHSCSTSSGTHKSSGEIGRLSFFFINCYVPVLTLRLHCSEAALQFGENRTFMFL
jgi:hypothetical protein